MFFLLIQSGCLVALVFVLFFSNKNASTKENSTFSSVQNGRMARSTFSQTCTLSTLTHTHTRALKSPTCLTVLLLSGSYRDVSGSAGRAALTGSCGYSAPWTLAAHQAGSRPAKDPPPLALLALLALRTPPHQPSQAGARRGQPGPLRKLAHPNAGRPRAERQRKRKTKWEGGVRYG